jgi:hypothetical protein
MDAFISCLHENQLESGTFWVQQLMQLVQQLMQPVQLSQQVQQLMQWVPLV